MTTRVRKSHQLTLRDRLSQLNILTAEKLLGSDGRRLIRTGGAQWDIAIPTHVFLNDDLMRVTIPEEFDERGQPVRVTITRMAEARQRLHWNCSACDSPCKHVGAVFSLILEEKLGLGLSVPPTERVPIESLPEDVLTQQALAEREERARTEKMRIKPADVESPWTDYVVTNAVTGKSYRVALRGFQPGEAYCTCPDFRTNTLGTCKHILRVARHVRKRFSSQRLARAYRPKQLALYLKYGLDLELRCEIPERLSPEVEQVVAPWRGQRIDDLQDLMRRLSRLEQLDHEVTVYPDAEEFIQNRLLQERLSRQVETIRRAPAKHPLSGELLKTKLLPYQLDGIAFAVGAGRAILADDMGLGKTIQGIGVGEMLAREVGISKVLVICPASLKSQWRAEIRRFSDRDVQLVVGSAAARVSQYRSECFYTICNYEQVIRDIDAIEPVKWDLIVLDEGQRIKNWETRTSQVVKRLRSTFALVLSGTPLENRLDDLYSIAQFIDDRRLGPAFRFFNRHRIVDDKGAVLGYKNLTQLRETLRPVLLRRTRDSVKLDLPERTTELVRIAPTDEQLAVHSANMRIVRMILKKRFLTEMDLLRLRSALLMCRMSANSTFLVDKEPPGESTKLAHLADLLERLCEEPDRKIVLFSEWTTMLDLIEPIVKRLGASFVRLDGSVPQAQRSKLVHQFQTAPDCRLFITTNAGSTGLNLQAANTVINVDLPWNPAVLEQRIARAHRMGQKQPVQVYVLITEQTIEEQLLGTLASKQQLALAALDPDTDVDMVALTNSMDDLKKRLEVLIGAKPEAPVDVSQRRDREEELVPDNVQRRERVAAAGGELLGAAFHFLGELVASQGSADAAPSSQVCNDLKSRLSECVDHDDQGRPRLTVTLPNQETLDQLAQTLARLLSIGKP